ncbi:MAG: hypothetical protein H6974_11160 [Gammaproteobacteria bacterium]|nr:hypothetical protein [Gammaproteobacteria bacterium]
MTDSLLSPPSLRKKGLQSATTHRQPGQALTPSPKFIARLFGEEILAFAAQLAQRRAAKKEGGAS